MKHDHLINFSELPDSFKQNASRTVEKRDFAAQISAAMAITDPADAKARKAKGETLEYRYRSKEEKQEALDAIFNQGLEKLANILDKGIDKTSCKA